VKKDTKLINVIIIFLLINSLLISLINENQVSAEDIPPSWPTNWIYFSLDPNEDAIGPQHDRRDIHHSYYYFDENFLYLRLECYGTPDFTEEPDCRYKWFIDLDYNGHFSGQNIVDGEFLLFVEDFDNNSVNDDGIGDVFLLEDLDSNGEFDEWEVPPNYYSNGLVLDPNIAGYRILGNCVDLYVNLANIGNPTESCFLWATDQENANLNQGPTLDSINIADLSIEKIDNPDPVFEGEFLTYTIHITNLGPNTAENVNIFDTLPTSVTYNSAEPAPTGFNGNILWWIYSAINSGNTETISINVTIDSSIPAVITNNVNTSSDTHDLTPYNNEEIEETTVYSRNEPPLAVDDEYLVEEGGYLNIDAPGVLENDIDPNGDSLTALLISGPDFAENFILYSDGSFDYTHDGGETLDDSFIYYAIDPDGKYDPATVKITIIPINDPPVAHNDTYNTPEDTPAWIAVLTNDNDVDGTLSPSTIQITTPPAFGETSINTTTGEIKYTPNINYNGQDTFHYTVKDNEGATSNQAIVMISIEAINDPPNMPNESTPRDGARNVELNTILNWSCHDVDSSNLTYDVYFGTSNPPPLLAANITDIRYDPRLDYFTTYFWKIIAWDNHDESNSSEIWSFITSRKDIIGNKNPIADSSGGEPYIGFVGEEIIFNGSKSYDPDPSGYIIEWFWDFGDGENGTGEITNHIYLTNGTFEVTLIVTDNRYGNDSDIFEVIITSGNYPPTKPKVTGPLTGHKKISYEFNAFSMDFDNDSIQYIFDWDDGEITTTDFLGNGIIANQTHDWSEYGEYKIIVNAYDNETKSASTYITILIDVLPIDDLIEGLLIDLDSNGSYELFKNSATGKKTPIKLENGTYLIDSDDDKKWDHTYTHITGEVLTYYDYLYKKFYHMVEADLQTQEIPGFELIILLAAMVLILIFLKRRK
jgi:uncharacterized repeat protein (TIGR01451 family)